MNEYADRLGVTAESTVVSLGEGGTPLVPAPALSKRTGAQVWVKFEGMNPTGSFKDRGMTVALSRAVEHGAKAVICASTGNTSASAAAYAAHAGITAAVLVPEGKIAMGKLSQAVAHNGQLIQIRGNFDDCLEIARELADNYPVHLVNSVNPDRIEGQKTAAYEIVEVLVGMDCAIGLKLKSPRRVPAAEDLKHVDEFLLLDEGLSASDDEAAAVVLPDGASDVGGGHLDLEPLPVEFLVVRVGVLFMGPRSAGPVPGIVRVAPDAVKVALGGAHEDCGDSS